MSQILNKIRNVDPNDSDAVKVVLSGFFQNLPKHTQSTNSLWLKALESVINRFPKYCMSHRSTIESYLVNFLDCPSYYTVIDAAKCGHALQQVRPSQEKTATPKVCWREQMELLCNAAHNLIGSIFTNDVYRNGSHFQETTSESIVANTPLSKVLADISNLTGTTESKDVADRNAILTVRLHNVFVFIQAMLVETYPVAKPVRPHLILDVTLRALTASSGKDQSLGDVVSVKSQALRILDALAVCLGPNLIPFSPLIFRMLMQTLRWSTDNPSEESRAVRRQAYTSLAGWLSTLQCHAPDTARRDVRGRSMEDELVSCIVNDVTPLRHVVELTMGSQPTKHMSKKAKRKLTNTMLQESNLAARMPGEKNKSSISEETTDEVAVAALVCAEVFLTVCGVFMKPATHKLLQERLIRECYRLDDYSVGRALALCRALEAARRSPPSGLPPPTHHCLQLYSVLRNSRYKEISMVACQALLSVRLHLHCSPPSLHFTPEPAPEPRGDSQPAPAQRHVVSDTNRAALEQLLGAARMQSITEASEVITIPDEPSSKKPRLNDEKISLSSQSSVEISDDSNNEDVELIPTQIIIEDDKVSNVEFVKPAGKDATDSNIKFDKEKLPQNVYEEITQIPTNAPISGDTIDGRESPHSVEVVYDYPSTGKGTVPVLEKMEEDNLPSSTETDDIQITCGQQVNSSQDTLHKKVDDLEVKEVEVVKVNGLDEKLTNGENSEKIKSSVTVKITEGVTVEDMLADFVDEVKDDVINVDL